MIKYLKLIRVKHWFKNLLVFLPLFFSLLLCNLDKLYLVFIGFIVFSISSSIIYIINDINDIEDDKKNEHKKNRPLASGAISIKNAIIADIILIFINGLLITYLYSKTGDLFVILLPVIYCFLNFLYSISLKHKPIIDVVILVSGFLFRVIYGGIVINVEVSKWLYLMVVFGAFYLGFGKRRNEIIKSGKNGRKVLQYYSKDFLDKNMYVCLSLAIVSYSLWCVDPVTISRLNNGNLFWTIPLVMVIFQMYSLNIEGNSAGDPIEVVLSDKPLMGTILLYGIIMVFLLYLL